jgi:hypothetical protein
VRLPQRVTTATTTAAGPGVPRSTGTAAASRLQPARGGLVATDIFAGAAKACSSRCCTAPAPAAGPICRRRRRRCHSHLCAGPAARWAGHQARARAGSRRQSWRQRLPRAVSHQEAEEGENSVPRWPLCTVLPLACSALKPAAAPPACHLHFLCHLPLPACRLLPALAVLRCLLLKPRLCPPPSRSARARARAGGS